MTLLALRLILAAAFIHASWNLLAKRAGSGAAFVWLVALLSTLFYAPLVLLLILLQKPSIGGLELAFMAGTALLHVGYFVSLQRGYAVGDLSLVYPLARGSGPMLATLLAILLFSERPSPLALWGAALIVISIFFLTGGSSAPATPASRRALGYGLLTGSFIAAYTLWDKYAVSILLIHPLLYDWASNAGRSLLLTPHAMRHWAGIKTLWFKRRKEVLGVAILSPLAYLLVLSALIFTPVSYVAPAREISILIGILLGTRLLAEGNTKRRLTAASAMVLGVIALALG